MQILAFRIIPVVPKLMIKVIILFKAINTYLHGGSELVLRLKKHTMDDFCFFVLHRVWTFDFDQI